MNCSMCFFYECYLNDYAKKQCFKILFVGLSSMGSLVPNFYIYRNSYTDIVRIVQENLLHKERTYYEEEKYTTISRFAQN